MAAAQEPPFEQLDLVGKGVGIPGSHGDCTVREIVLVRALHRWQTETHP